METFVFLVVDVFFFQEVRQEYQCVEGAADQGEGGKQAEVPQQVALREEQAQEGADRGQATQYHGRGFFLEHLFHIFHVIVVDQHVQAVA